MRHLTSHKVNGLNDSIEVRVVDGPGRGSACHEYRIGNTTPSFVDDIGKEMARLNANCVIHFQSGPIGECGLNGISNEALLAVVEDRLVGFQSGDFACRENALALTKLQEAMMWLHKRTRDRVARGVEGTDVK